MNSHKLQRYFSIISAFLLTSCASQRSFDAMVPALNPSSKGHQIPLRITDKGEAFVNMKLNDKSIEALLDTGSDGNLSLNQEDFKQTADSKFGLPEFTWTLYDSRFSRRALVKRARLGSVEFSNFVVNQASSHIPRNLLGANFLRNFNVEINFPEHSMALYPHSYSPPQTKGHKGWEMIPIELAGSHIIVKGTIEGMSKPIRFVVDTGATASMTSKHKSPQYFTLLSGHTLKKLPQNSIKPMESGMVSVGKRKVFVGNKSIGNLHFISADLTDSIVLKLLRIDAFLGNEFFMQNAVFIDYKNSKLYFKAKSPATAK